MNKSLAKIFLSKNGQSFLCSLPEPKISPNKDVIIDYCAFGMISNTHTNSGNDKINNFIMKMIGFPPIFVIEILSDNIHRDLNMSNFSPSPLKIKLIYL